MATIKSIEEKAKAYDKAVNEIKGLRDMLLKEGVINENGVIYDNFNRIFPELKESEDERIWTINYLNNRKLNSSIIEEKESLKKAIAWLEKQGEQKPADKVESKFKVGDWVVKEYSDVSTANQVVEVKWLDSDYFQYTLDDGTYFKGSSSSDSWESLFHLWTIQDAKDGDVLADDYSIIIFRKIGNDTWNDVVDYYVGYNHSSDKINIQSGNSHYGNVNTVTFKPATKEQRDLLFSKMKESGYKWDAEKKELKKIEQKPAWSEEDEETLDYIIDYIENNKSHDKIYTKKTEILEGMIDWLKSLKERMKGE